jgi:4-amino-4-deoxy-L-arabinose transferase-like glycosyltransferase
MSRSFFILGLICLAGLALRLVLLPSVPHPGIADPNHYYQVGKSLVEGRGFMLDFLWQYNNPPADIVHEMDYWNPLAAVITAFGFTVFGVNVAAGVLPFAILGAFLPILAFFAGRQLKLDDESALFAAACTAFLPELMLHSLRTETTIPATVFVCGAILLINAGVRSQKIGSWLLAGICAGLAYLVRSDAALLLPMLVVTLGVYRIVDLTPQSPLHSDLTPQPPLHSDLTPQPPLLKERGSQIPLPMQWGGVRGGDAPMRWGSTLRRLFGVSSLKIFAYALFSILIAGMVITPWLLRNQQLFGTPTTPHLSNMFFLTHHDEHFAVDDVFTLETLLANQSIGQLIGKRLFELAAAFKVMVTSLDNFLPIAVWGGLLLLILRREKDRLLVLAPTLILLFGLLVFYPVLVPMKAQGGSFKKAFLALIPLLLPLAGYALEIAITDKRLRRGVMLLVVLMIAIFGIDAVRLDMQFVRDYMAYTENILDTLEDLPDVTGDGTVRLMNQDPFMMSFYGVQSVMTPRDDREAVLTIARKYQIDYLLVPTARPELDAVVWFQTETDSRFQHVINVSRSNLQIYRFVFDS